MPLQDNKDLIQRYVAAIDANCANGACAQRCGGRSERNRFRNTAR
jgi:hypothetical protein